MLNNYFIKIIYSNCLREFKGDFELEEQQPNFSSNL